MKSIASFSLFFLCSIIGFGQNYALFNSGEKAYFEYQNTYSAQIYYNVCQDCYFEASLDSLTTAGQLTAIHHKNTIRFLGFTNCVEIIDTSLFGQYSMMQNNGDYFFFNENADTILIKSQANLNVNWTFYHGNNYTIEANVASITSQVLFNVNDNIKVITLTKKDNFGNILPSPVNNVTIEISENYGLISSPNFLYFPNNLTAIELQGHTALVTPFKNITWADIYDFDIGDEFHTRYVYRPTWSYFTWVYFKKIVNSKQVLMDSIQYIFDVERVTINENNGNPDTTFTSYTETKTYSNSHISDGVAPLSSYTFYPNGSYALDYYEVSFHDTDNNFMNGRMVKTSVSGAGTYLPNDTCNMYPIDGYSEEEYIEGAGGPYNWGWGFDPSEYKLHYFKKGNETWGTPFNIPLLTSSKSIIQKYTIEIAPNPVAEFLQFSKLPTIDDSQLMIFDVNGRLVFQKMLTADQKQINIKDLSQGIYMLKIQSKSKVWTGKFIKR